MQARSTSDGDAFALSPEHHYRPGLFYHLPIRSADCLIHSVAADRA